MPSDWCRTKQYKTNRIFVAYKIHLHTKSTVPPTKLSAKASAPPSESYAYIQAQFICRVTPCKAQVIVWVTNT